MKRIDISDNPLRKIVHFCAALIILSGGFNLFLKNYFNKTVFLICCISSLGCLVYAIFFKYFSNKFFNLESVINVLEALFFLLIGYFFIRNDQMMEGIALYLAALAYTLAAIVSIKKRKNS